MESKGTHVLKSGNTLEWEQVEAGNRGGIRASFAWIASEQDLAEGKAWLRARMPENGVPTGDCAVIHGDEATSAVLNKHLYGSSQN